MDDEDRGKIRNRRYANQVRDFSGLRFGNITPTDIDLLIEYKNICYVYAEFKYENASVPRGQKWALERLCDDTKKPSIAIIASHHAGEDEDIDAANTTVTEFRFNGAWHSVDSETTTKELVTRFINWAEFGDDTRR